MALFILTCRNFNKYYIYILFSSIFFLIYNICFGLNYHNILKEINIKNIFTSEEEPKRFTQFFIRQIFCYLVTFILSFIFDKIENKRKRETLISSTKNIREDSIESLNSQLDLIFRQTASITILRLFFYIFFV